MARKMAVFEILPWRLVVLLMFVQIVSGQSSTNTSAGSTEAANSTVMTVSDPAEWGEPGNYSIMVISEVGQNAAPDVLNITSRYLSTKRGEKINMVFVQISSTEADVRKAICDQMKAQKQRVPSSSTINAVIDTTRSQELTKKVATALAPLQLPTFAMGCCSSKYERGYMASMPSGTKTSAERVDDQTTRITFSSFANYMTLAARYVIQNESLATAALYYDDRFDLERGHTLLLTNVAARHKVVELAYSTPAKAADQLKRASQDQLFNIFLLTQMRTAEAYVLQAENFNMGKAKYSWFVVTTDMSDFKCSNCKEARVNVFRPEPADMDEAEKILQFFKSQDALLVVPVTQSVEGGTTSAYDNVYLSGPNSTTPASKATEYNALPKLNATLTTKVLFYYDALSASIKMLKQLKENLPSVDVAEAMCGNPTVPSSAAPFNLSNIAEETVHQGVLGMVSMAADRDEDKGLVYVQATVLVKQYNFRGNSSEDGGKTIPSNEPNITRFGTWTLDDGLQRDPNAPLTQLSRKIYRITVMDIKPFVFKADNLSTTPWQGYCIDLINEIAKDLQFDYTIYQVEDNTYGVLNDTTGEWDGLVRELVDKRAEIALAPLSVMAERENVVDFTVPYFDLVGITILMKKIKEPPSLFKFIEVLEGQVWFAIIGAYVVTSILLFIFDRFSPYSYRNVLKRREKELTHPAPHTISSTTTTQMVGNGFNKAMPITTLATTTTTTETLAPEEDFYGSRVFTLKESFWFCMTSLTPQGGGEAPRNLSGRLVAATWWMFGFIIIASYTANLAAFLTVSRLESSIESLDDLSKQYGIKYAPQKGTATETYFRRMALIEDKFYQIWRDMSLNETMDEKERAKLAVWDYPVSDKYTKLWLTMQENQRPNTFEEGIRMVKASVSDEEGFAFIGDAALLQYEANMDVPKCELTLVGEEFSRKPYALAVQENSHLKEELSGAILKLLNARKLEQLKENWWKQHQSDCNKRDESNEGISIENIGGVFIVVLVGTVVACVMLAVEFYWYRLRKTAKVDELRTSTVAKVLGHAFGGREEAIAVKQREHHGGLPDVAMY